MQRLGSQQLLLPARSELLQPLQHLWIKGDAPACRFSIASTAYKRPKIGRDK